MAITFGFFHDALLTQPVAGGTPIAATQAADNSIAAVDKPLWFGSPTPSKKAQVSSSPGVAQIAVSIADSAGGSGLATTAIKLATTQGGLAGATAGAALNIGATVTSGTANAVALWARIDAPAIAAGVYTDLSLTTQTLVETTV